MNVDKSDVKIGRRNNSKVYILDVDFEFPEELHVLHNNYSLALE